MPTAAERQALLFLAAVAIVGAGARMVAAARFDSEIRGGQAGTARTRDGASLIAAQIAAVDSARAENAKRGTAGTSTRRRSPRASPDTSRESGVTRRAPEPRSSSRAQQPTLSRGGRGDPPGPIDVNSASAKELERLPRVGPALARRIVDYREAHGSFGSIDDLRHVRGIGVTTASLLAPLVTFSSGYRPLQSEGRSIRRDPAAREH